MIYTEKPKFNSKKYTVTVAFVIFFPAPQLLPLFASLEAFLAFSNYWNTGL